MAKIPALQKLTHMIHRTRVHRVQTAGLVVLQAWEVW